MAISEQALGSRFAFLRHEITLKSVGRRTVYIGRGIVVGIGTSTRGPAFEPYGIMQGDSSRIKRIFGAGPLKEDLETALDQGCSVVYGVRVLGTGYATASADLNDSQTIPNKIGVLKATGPGAWGNNPSYQVTYGDLDGTLTENLVGDGGADYYLEMDDLVEHATNKIEVGGTEFTIVYEGSPDNGEVRIDLEAGKLTFHSTQKPTDSQTITARYKFKSRKLTVWDGEGQPWVANNCTSLTMLAAKMSNCPTCTFTAEYGETHLPAVMASPAGMTGGLDGAAITIDDWEAAFDIVNEKMPDKVIPSAVFTTDYEVTEGQKDIVPLMDAFLVKMSTKQSPTPTQGFVNLPITMDHRDMIDFRHGYDNMWMTLIANGLSETGRNLSAARAGQEAALPLGTSPALPSVSFRGVDGLMKQFDNETEREELTYGNVEVLVKKNGIRPYVGVTTNPDDNFFRTVDVRTINWCVILADQIIQNYYNARRTLTNLMQLQKDIWSAYELLRKDSVLDDFSVQTSPHPTDRNAVIIKTWIQPVGHMERFYNEINVGYWSDRVAE